MGGKSSSEMAHERLMSEIDRQKLNDNYDRCLKSEQLSRDMNLDKYTHDENIKKLANAALKEHFDHLERMEQMRNDHKQVMTTLGNQDKQAERDHTERKITLNNDHGQAMKKLDHSDNQHLRAHHETMKNMDHLQQTKMKQIDATQEQFRLNHAKDMTVLNHQHSIGMEEQKRLTQEAGYHHARELEKNREAEATNRKRIDADLAKHSKEMALKAEDQKMQRLKDQEGHHAAMTTIGNNLTTRLAEINATSHALELKLQEAKANGSSKYISELVASYDKVNACIEKLNEKAAGDMNERSENIMTKSLDIYAKQLEVLIAKLPNQSSMSDGQSNLAK